MERVHWFAVATGLAGFILGNLFFMVFLVAPDRDAEIAEAVAEETVMVLATGQFVGADAIRRGSGRVQLLETEKGHVLRFVGFDVSDAPALKVVMAKSGIPKDVATTARTELLELGDLKARNGPQNYALPKGEMGTDYAAVLVWSEKGGGLLAVAGLRKLDQPVPVDAYRATAPRSTPKPSTAEITAPLHPPKPEEEEG